MRLRLIIILGALLLATYNHDLQMSKMARLNWIEPDLKPLI
jgi:hypothetical protein